MRRLSLVMPQGYAGVLEPLFRPVMRGLVAREQQLLRCRSGAKPIVICPFPYLAPWVRGVPNDRIVYYNLDEYTFYDRSRAKRIVRLEAELVARARLTVCLSVHQVETLRARNPASANRIQHLPLGVVEEFFNPEPLLAPVPNTVGYVGNLTDRVDWGLVIEVARRLPNARFHFVGRLGLREDGARWRQKRSQALGLDNVIYEGEVPQAAVREHYWRYAVNWMPYDVINSFNIASCPTKIMDALASGRPFLSTDIPEVRLYPEHIQIASTPKEAVSKLAAMLCGALPHNTLQQLTFVDGHRWSTRAMEFRRLLE